MDRIPLMLLADVGLVPADSRIGALVTVGGDGARLVHLDADCPHRGRAPSHVEVTAGTLGEVVADGTGRWCPCAQTLPRPVADRLTCADQRVLRALAAPARPLSGGDPVGAVAALRRRARDLCTPGAHPALAEAGQVEVTRVAGLLEHLTGGPAWRRALVAAYRAAATAAIRSLGGGRDRVPVSSAAAPWDALVQQALRSLPRTAGGLWSHAAAHRVWVQVRDGGFAHADGYAWDVDPRQPELVSMPVLLTHGRGDVYRYLAPGLVPRGEVPAVERARSCPEVPTADLPVVAPPAAG